MSFYLKIKFLLPSISYFNKVRWIRSISFWILCFLLTNNENRFHIPIFVHWIHNANKSKEEYTTRRAIEIMS